MTFALPPCLLTQLEQEVLVEILHAEDVLEVTEHTHYLGYDEADGGNDAVGMDFDCNVVAERHSRAPMVLFSCQSTHPNPDHKSAYYVLVDVERRLAGHTDWVQCKTVGVAPGVTLDASSWELLAQGLGTHLVVEVGHQKSEEFH